MEKLSRHTLIQSLGEQLASVEQFEEQGKPALADRAKVKAARLRAALAPLTSSELEAVEYMRLAFLEGR